MDEHLYFILHANCVVVKGASRAVIYDLHRGTFDFISHALYTILTDYSEITPAEIKASFGHAHDQTIHEYFHFLLEREYIHFCPREAKQLFPRMGTKWEHPATITNAVIDIGEQHTHITTALIEQLERLGCNYLQLRVYHIAAWEALITLLTGIHLSRIHLVELFLPYDETIDKSIESLAQEGRLFKVVIYNAPFEKLDISDSGSCVVYTTQNIKSEKCCGNIGSQYFAVNIPHYTESLAQNTCLNRKVSIDQDGNIKNCPSLPDSYGNIVNTMLHEAVEMPGFKRYWGITKDQISICQDCEFRHICTDCRAYLEDPEDKYSKPLKCGYNPYTCEWEEWSTNPLKQKAIGHYQLI